MLIYLFLIFFKANITFLLYFLKQIYLKFINVYKFMIIFSTENF